MTDKNVNNQKYFILVKTVETSQKKLTKNPWSVIIEQLQLINKKDNKFYKETIIYVTKLLELA
jgi:hypothetical protein